MSAGTGVRHSEFNHSAADPVHLLQIWILPERRGITPGYEQRHFGSESKRGKLLQIAGREGGDSVLKIHQDADLYAAVLAPGETVEHRLQPGRHAWVQAARGSILVNGTPLAGGDGAGISEEGRLEIVARDHSELLIFDLS